MFWTQDPRAGPAGLGSVLRRMLRTAPPVPDPRSLPRGPARDPVPGWRRGAGEWCRALWRPDQTRGNRRLGARVRVQSTAGRNREDIEGRGRWCRVHQAPEAPVATPPKIPKRLLLEIDARKREYPDVHIPGVKRPR